MKHWKDLNKPEQQQLLLFPVYLSLLAGENKLDEKEQHAVIKLAHIKSYSSDNEFIDFYKAAETDFEKQLNSLNESLPSDKTMRKHVITEAILELQKIVKKLEPVYAKGLLKSMQSYKNFVSKAHQNVLEYFIFPLPLEGITD